MDPLLGAALSQRTVTLFCAVRIDLTATLGRPLLLLDGAGQVTFGGETYLGRDLDFGVLDAMEVISDGGGDDAPEIGIAISPPGATAVATLASPAMQGAEVRVFVGAIDDATGAPIGTPELKFTGEVDVPALSVSTGERKLDLSIVSAFERMFEVEEGVRAQDGWHQSIWPGELGLEYMTGTDRNLYWGGNPPAGHTSSLSASARGLFDAGASYALAIARRSIG